MSKQERGRIIVDNGIEQTDEGLEVRVFPENVEPAKASINMNATVNMGNYNNMKVGVHVSLPCYEEEIDSALEKAQGICEEKMAELMAKVRRKKRG